MAARALVRSLIDMRPAPGRRDGPLVSIVVVNRNGVRHLRRLLTGLEQRTNYGSFEVVLVDNGSTDNSISQFTSWPGGGKLIRNDANLSFSRANNQGILEATGEFVLLANNDIDPMHPDWLGYLVESALDGAAAVGALLVYPPDQRLARPGWSDRHRMRVQHAGVAFLRSGWGVRAENLAVGADPRSIAPPGRRRVPAVTAACLLARRSDLLDEPLDEGYWYGSEDWDLCLRLGRRGSIVLDERAVLYHHEYGTADRIHDDAWTESRQANHRWFNERWGPELQRSLRSEATNTDRSFFRYPTTPRLLVTTTDQQTMTDPLRRQAENMGWEVTNHERSLVDLAVACDVPRSIHRFGGHDMSAAIVLGDHDRWATSGALDAAHVVLVPDHLGRARVDAAWGRGIARVFDVHRTDGNELFEAVLAHVRPRSGSLRIGISTSAPSWDEAQYWGDTFLARGLMRAVRRRGHEATELIRQDWRAARATSCDVVVHLRGLHRRRPARGQRNVLWIISHPERIEADECDDYDVICCASRRHADRLTSELGRPVHFLPQATDTDVFGVGPPDVDLAAPVLYVGIARSPSRRAPRWMTQRGRRFHLYGHNWEGLPEETMLQGSFIPNRRLGAAYRSAKLVVADHHGSMRTEGFVANRLFDVLASGGVVVSDDVAGVHELFGDLVPTYRDADELVDQIDRLIADDEARRRIADEGHRLVMAHHTLDHRAATILELVDVIG